MAVGNNHWFERNCDPSDVEQQEEVVQSGGGNTGSPSGGSAPNTLAAAVETLLGQCYGDQGTLTKDNFPDLEVEPLPPPQYINWGPILDTILGTGSDVPDTRDIQVDFDIGRDEGVTGAASYYVQAGPSLISTDGADGKTEFSGKGGLGVAVSEAVGVYGEVSFLTDDVKDTAFGGKLGVKYAF